jgi:hypothetical protein
MTDAELIALAVLVQADALNGAAEVAMYQRRLTEPNYPALNQLQDELHRRKVIP